MTHTSSVSFATRLQELKKAFIEGQSQSVCETELSSGWAFLKCLEADLESQFSIEVRRGFWGVYCQYEDALQTARDGQFRQAEKEFCGLTKYVQTASALSDCARRLAAAFIAAGEAYVQHKLQNDAAACRLLCRASALDDDLIGTGLSVMNVHSLQVAHNRLRILLRRGERANAIRLAGFLIDRTEELARAVPSTSHRPWGDQGATAPTDFSSYYFDKVCAEISLALLGQGADVARLFQRFAQHVDAQDRAPAGFGRRGHEWLRCKTILLRGETDEFLSAAVDPLSAGRQELPALWLATVSDAAHACTLLGPEGRQLAEWMRTESHRLNGQRRIRPHKIAAKSQPSSLDCAG